MDLIYEIEKFMKKEGLRGSVTVDTLLDELDDAGYEGLVAAIEDATGDLDLSGSARVDTLLRKYEAFEQDDEEGEIDEEDEAE